MNVSGIRLTLIAAALLPALSQAGDGPYVGLEGGANWAHKVRVKQGGAEVGQLQFDNGWAAGLALGYAFENGWRPELEYLHHNNKITTSGSPGTPGIGGIGGTPSTLTQGSIPADSYMANLWYDIKSSEGFFKTVHPYVGAGVGSVHYGFRNATVNGTYYGDHSTNQFGYQAGGGVGVDLTRHLTLAIDYRYMQAKRGYFAVAGGQEVNTFYRANMALASLRYSFGSEPPPPPPAPEPAVEVVPVEPAPPPVEAAPEPAPACNPPAGLKVDENCHIVEQSLVIQGVDFEFNSAQLTAPAQQTLDSVATALAAQPEVHVEIQGHTDNIGTAKYNLKLSQRRAESVKAYLVSKGVNADNLTAKGFGLTKPIADNSTDEGRAKNRRVDFEVTKAPADLKVKTEGASEASTDAAEQALPPAETAPAADQGAAAEPAAPEATPAAEPATDAAATAPSAEPAAGDSATPTTP